MTLVSEQQSGVADRAERERHSRRYSALLRRVARLRYLRWIALGSVLLFWIASQAAISNVERNLGKLHNDGFRDPFWAVNQLNVETNRFLVTLSRYASNSQDSASVQRRFDILWSRSSTITSDILYTAHHEMEIDLDGPNLLAAHLRLYEPDILSLEALDTDRLEAMYLDFEDVRKQLHELAIELLHAESVVREQRRDELQAFLGTARMMGNMLLLFMLLLIFVFAVDSARLRLLLRGNRELLTESMAASEAKSQFISVVSHELRTPLTSINGSIKLLLGGGGGKLDDVARNLLTIANRNAVQLSRIIDDLLDIEKLEKGGAKLNIEQIDLSQLAKHAMQTLEDVARKSDVKLVGTIQNDLTYQGDGSRLSRVLDNLISNAIKFTEAGGTVTVVLRRAPNKMLIEVRDTGIGIPPEQISKIFQRFHQVDATDRRKLGGAGLGLSIAQTIVNMHGGDISVDSVLGEGTIFKVELPDTLP